MTATMVNGCAFFFGPSSPNVEAGNSNTEQVPEQVIEGVWQQASTGHNYEISSSGDTFGMSYFKINSNGERSYSSSPTTFERGARRIVDSRHGYLYGYNKSRPGWIAYYYSISGDRLSLTSCLNNSDGVTWSSLEDAMSQANIAKPGVVKMDLTRE